MRSATRARESASSRATPASELPPRRRVAGSACEPAGLSSSDGRRSSYHGRHPRFEREAICLRPAPPPLRRCWWSRPGSRVAQSLWTPPRSWFLPSPDRYLATTTSSRTATPPLSRSRKQG